MCDKSYCDPTRIWSENKFTLICKVHFLCEGKLYKFMIKTFLQRLTTLITIITIITSDPFFALIPLIVTPMELFR